MESEFFGVDGSTKTKNISVAYSWFISKVLKSYRTSFNITNLEYRTTFKDAFVTRKAILEERGYNQQDIELYEKKINILLEHLGNKFNFLNKSFHK